MKLTELNPEFVGHGGEGVSDANGQPVPRREQVGIQFDCPCGCDNPLFVPFENPLDGGPGVYPPGRGWTRRGGDFDVMTLTPSILRKDCGWHGFVTNGEIQHCTDAKFHTKKANS